MISRVQIAPSRTSVRSISPRARSTVCNATNVKFSVSCHVPFGTELVVTGDCEKLGDWDAAQGVKMHWSEGDLWTASVEMPPGSHELKYAMLKKGGCVGWIEGRNVVLELPADATTAEIKTETKLEEQYYMVASDISINGVSPATPAPTAEAEATTIPVAEAVTPPDAKAVTPPVPEKVTTPSAEAASTPVAETAKTPVVEEVEKVFEPMVAAAKPDVPKPATPVVSEPLVAAAKSSDPKPASPVVTEASNVVELSKSVEKEAVSAGKEVAKAAPRATTKGKGKRF